jgi:DNA-binding NarL/FixJ family response regulator
VTPPAPGDEPAIDEPAIEEPAIDVLIADDDPVVRFGLRMMLSGASDLRVVAEAGDGAEAVELARRHHPDVVLMDIRMPGTDGLTATERLRGDSPAPQVMVLTTFDADAHVLRALRAGAAGFLLKDTPPDELVVAIRHAAQGRPVLSPEVTRRLIAKVAESDEDARRATARERLDVLGEREREVAVEIGAGRSNAEIAARYFLGLTTVKTHVSSILTKLGLNNRVQVALLVQEAGLGSSDRPE